MSKKTKATRIQAKGVAKGSARGAKVTPTARPLLSRLAKGLVKAMGAQASKKSQTKAAPKMSKGKKSLSVKVQDKSAGHKSTPKAFPKTLPAKAVAAKPEKVDKKAKATEKTSEKSSKPKSPPVVAVLAPAVKAGKEAKGKRAPGRSSPGKGAEEALLAAERMCRESGCENSATTKGYCRLDYIKNWKKIKRKEMILKEGKLNQYIEELVSKYPDKYIEVIRQDLSTEVNFTKVIHDLELDESIDDLDYDGDSIDSLIGAIRKEDDSFDDTDF
jgi:hypothetical protein